MATLSLNRRSIVCGLAAGALIPLLPGCSENALTGRSQFVLVDDAQLAQLSASAWEQIKAQERMSTDVGLNRRLAKVGEAVVRAAGLESAAPWEFAVFDNPTVNAFVMPGGRVGFFSGIFEKFKSDDDIAVVMGHEVGHVAGRHAAERVSQSMAAQAAISIGQAVIANSDISFKQEAAAIFGAGVTFGVLKPYSRKHEYEADRLGVDYAAKAGYDPRAALAFWDRMNTSGPGGGPLEWASTHPSDESRREALEALLV
jgi:predicted Zn-dependent protease